jgi:hypothetical protein
MTESAQDTRRHDVGNQLRQIKLDIRLLGERLECPCEQESVASASCRSLVQAMYDTALRLPIRRCRSGLRKLNKARVARGRSRHIDSFLEATAQPWTECDISMHAFDRGSAVQPLMRSLEGFATGDQVVSLQELRLAATRRVQSTLEAVRRGDEEGLDERSSELLDRILRRLPDELGEGDVETAGMIEELWASPSFKSAYLKQDSDWISEPCSWDEW